MEGSHEHNNAQQCTQNGILCPGCQNEFSHERVAKLLPCLHTLCQSCIVSKSSSSNQEIGSGERVDLPIDLDTSSNDGQLKCPECDTTYTAEQVTLNPFIDIPKKLELCTEDGGSSEGKYAICTSCDDNQRATSFCIECQECLCDPCVVAHKRVKLTKDHSISNQVYIHQVEESSAAEVRPQQRYCQIHKLEKLQLFCLTCEELTCRDCQLKEHRDHQYQFIEQAIQDQRAHLRTSLDELKSKLAISEELSEKLSDKAEDVNKQKIEVYDEVREVADTVSKALLSWCKKLLYFLQGVCQTRVRDISEKKDEVNAFTRKASDTIKFVESALTSRCDLSLLSVKQLMSSNISQLQNQTINVPDSLFNLTIKYENDTDFLIQNVTKMGSVNINGRVFPQSGGETDISSVLSEDLNTHDDKRKAGLKDQNSQKPHHAPKAHHVVSASFVPGNEQNSQNEQNSHNSHHNEQKPEPKQFMKEALRKQQHQQQCYLVRQQQQQEQQQRLQLQQQEQLQRQQQQKQLQRQQQQQQEQLQEHLQRQQQLKQLQRQNRWQQQQQQQQFSQGQQQGMLGLLLGSDVAPVIGQHSQHQTDSTAILDLYGTGPQMTPQGQGAYTQQGSMRSAPNVARQHQPRQQQHPYQQQINREKISAVVQNVLQSRGSQQTANGVEGGQTKKNFIPGSQLPPGRIDSIDPLNLRSGENQQGVRIKQEPRENNPSCQFGTNGFTSTDRSTVVNGTSSRIYTEYSAVSASLKSPPTAKTTQKPTPSPSNSDGAPAKPRSPVVKSEPLSVAKDSSPALSKSASTALSKSASTALSKPESADVSFVNKPASTALSKPESTALSKPESTALSKPASTALSKTESTSLSKPEPTALSKPASVEVAKPESPAYAKPDSPAIHHINLELENDRRELLKDLGNKNTYLLRPDHDPSDPSEDYCSVCHNGGDLLCCEKCPKVFHMQCHIPALSADLGQNDCWTCRMCIPDEQLMISTPLHRDVDMNSNGKRKSPKGLIDKEIKVCERLLLELFCLEQGIIFHEPVPKSVPNYNKIIQRPMDFSTIKCKLRPGHFAHYDTVEEFLSDVMLVFHNCFKFNPPTSEVHDAGRSVEVFFESLVEHFLPCYMPYLSRRQTPSPALAPSDSETDEPPRTKKRKSPQDWMQSFLDK